MSTDGKDKASAYCDMIARRIAPPSFLTLKDSYIPTLYILDDKDKGFNDYITRVTPRNSRALVDVSDQLTKVIKLKQPHIADKSIRANKSIGVTLFHLGSLVYDGGFSLHYVKMSRLTGELLYAWNALGGTFCHVSPDGLTYKEMPKIGRKITINLIPEFTKIIKVNDSIGSFLSDPLIMAYDMTSHGFGQFEMIVQENYIWFPEVIISCIFNDLSNSDPRNTLVIYMPRFNGIIDILFAYIYVPYVFISVNINYFESRMSETHAEIKKLLIRMSNFSIYNGKECSLFYYLCSVVSDHCRRFKRPLTPIQSLLIQFSKGQDHQSDDHEWMDDVADKILINLILTLKEDERWLFYLGARCNCYYEANPMHCVNMLAGGIRGFIDSETRVIYKSDTDWVSVAIRNGVIKNLTVVMSSQSNIQPNIVRDPQASANFSMYWVGAKPLMFNLVRVITHSNVLNNLSPTFNYVITLDSARCIYNNKIGANVVGCHSSYDIKKSVEIWFVSNDPFTYERISFIPNRLNTTTYLVKTTGALLVSDGQLTVEDYKNFRNFYCSTYKEVLAINQLGDLIEGEYTFSPSGHLFLLVIASLLRLPVSFEMYANYIEGNLKLVKNCENIRKLYIESSFTEHGNVAFNVLWHSLDEFLSIIHAAKIFIPRLTKIDSNDKDITLVALDSFKERLIRIYTFHDLNDARGGEQVRIDKFTKGELESKLHGN